MVGWQGKLLRINLGSGRIDTELIADEFLEEHLGGYALAKGLAELEDVSLQNNKIIFSSGALTGTGAPASAFCAMVGCAPSSDELTYVSVPLSFGAELKFCGYDALVIEGESETWCYVLIDGENIKILPAEEIFDFSPSETEKFIRSAFDSWHGNEIKIISSGELGTSLNGLVTDGFLLNDTKGLGGLFSQKRLKAIALRGIFDLKIAQPSHFCQLLTDAIKKFNQKREKFEESFYQIFQKTHLPLFMRIQREATERKACFGCPIACLFKKNGEFLPSFLEAYSLNRLMGINSFEDALDLYSYCLRRGIDVIALGLSARMLIEIGRKGEFEIPLKAGDKEGILRLLQDESSLLHKGADYLAKEFKVETELIEINEKLERVKNNLFSEIENFDKKINTLEALGFCPYVLFAFPYELLLNMYHAVTGKTIKE